MVGNGDVRIVMVGDGDVMILMVGDADNYDTHSGGMVIVKILIVEEEQ